MTESLIWDIDKIFEYNEKYQEHTGDGVIYYGCELLIDFGPFEKGHKCNIYINSQTSGDFTMRVGCDGLGNYGKKFVPVWTYISNEDDKDISYHSTDSDDSTNSDDDINNINNSTKNKDNNKNDNNSNINSEGDVLDR